MELTVSNYSGKRIAASGLRELAKKLGKKHQKAGLSFISRKEMRQLNKKYRKMNKPTDVLSFSMNEGGFLGDVLICPDIAVSNAKRYGVTLGSEIARLTAHGILHLLGFDHGKKMFDMQDRILRRAGYA